MLIRIRSFIHGKILKTYFRIIEFIMDLKKFRTYEVGVSGNYTTGNIGDMAIGLSFKNKLGEKKIDYAIFHKNIKRTKSNKTILGGGGVIHDHIPGSLEAKLSFLTGENYLIGIGYQNISNKVLRDKFFDIVDKSKVVTVRDKNSLSKMNSYSKREVHLTACPAFTLNVPEVKINNRTAINFRPWFGLGAYGNRDLLHKHFDYPLDIDIDKAQSDYLNNMYKICNEVYNPVFIPFDLSDYYFAKRYLKGIPVLKYRPSVKLTLKRIAESSRVVATRYHSNVFSILCNKPMISIAYAPKVKELANFCNIKAQLPNEIIKSIEFEQPQNRDLLIESSNRNFDLMFDEMKLK